MPQLSATESTQLVDWIIHESSKLDLEGLEPNLFAKYVKSLVTRDVSSEAMVASLEDFLAEDQAKTFTESLQKRVENRDFSFDAPKPETPPPPPPKKEEKPKPVAVEQKETPKPTKEYSKPRKPEKETKEGREFTRGDKKEPYKGKKEVKELNRYQLLKRRDEQQKPKETGKKEDNKKYNKKRRFSSDESDSQSDDEANTQQLSLVNANEEPEVKPKVVKERFIVFVAGLEEKYNTFPRLYEVFHQFGRIAGIEIDRENGVSFIEFTKLSQAYRAVKKAPKALRNSMLRVEFANEPNPEAIAAIENEIEERQKAWEQKQSQESQPQTEVDQKQELINQMVELLKEKQSQYDALGDEDSELKAKLAGEIEEVKDMLEQAKMC